MQVLWARCDKSHNAATVSVANKHSTGEEAEAVPRTMEVSRRNRNLGNRKGHLENVKTNSQASPDKPCPEHSSLKTCYCEVY